ncbi:MAG: hypothetical protein Q4E24_01690 [bacterium]|nr:hypothetical protein [bacterium]
MAEWKKNSIFLWGVWLIFMIFVLSERFSLENLIILTVAALFLLVRFVTNTAPADSVVAYHLGEMVTITGMVILTWYFCSLWILSSITVGEMILCIKKSFEMLPYGFIQNRYFVGVVLGTAGIIKLMKKKIPYLEWIDTYLMPIPTGVFISVFYIWTNSMRVVWFFILFTMFMVAIRLLEELIEMSTSFWYFFVLGIYLVILLAVFEQARVQMAEPGYLEYKFLVSTLRVPYVAAGVLGMLFLFVVMWKQTYTINLYVLMTGIGSLLIAYMLQIQYVGYGWALGMLYYIFFMICTTHFSSHKERIFKIYIVGVAAMLWLIFEAHRCRLAVGICNLAVIYILWNMYQKSDKKGSWKEMIGFHGRFLVGIAVITGTHLWHARRVSGNFILLAILLAIFLFCLPILDNDRSLKRHISWYSVYFHPAYSYFTLLFLISCLVLSRQGGTDIRMKKAETLKDAYYLEITPRGKNNSVVSVKAEISGDITQVLTGDMRMEEIENISLDVLDFHEFYPFNGKMEVTVTDSNGIVTKWGRWNYICNYQE